MYSTYHICQSHLERATAAFTRPKSPKFLVITSPHPKQHHMHAEDSRKTRERRDRRGGGQERKNARKRHFLHSCDIYFIRRLFVCCVGRIISVRRQQEASLVVICSTSTSFPALLLWSLTKDIDSPLAKICIVESSTKQLSSLDPRG